MRGNGEDNQRLLAGEGSPMYQKYPRPLASYNDVVANKTLFMDTLMMLHRDMKTRVMIPVIGGKDLDLHRLFVEVTSRGGFEKVIRDRKWKEITGVFGFPKTTTNASFIFRKYYESLILHYEQIYVFGAKGWYLTAENSSLNSSSMAAPGSSSVNVRDASEGNSLPLVNCPVVGVIDGKFDHGYLVTVTAGSQILKGVLYHSPGRNLPAQNIYMNDQLSIIHQRSRRRRRKNRKERDPRHPKHNRSGYNFFFREQHAKLKPSFPGKDRSISKRIGELWNQLTEAEKAVYQDMGLKDKERYMNEMEDYREKRKVGDVIYDAVPIQRTHATVGGMVDAESSKLPAEESSHSDTSLEGSTSTESASNFEETDIGNKNSSELVISQIEGSVEPSHLVAERDSFKTEPRDENGNNLDSSNSNIIDKDFEPQKELMNQENY